MSGPVNTHKSLSSRRLARLLTGALSLTLMACTHTQPPSLGIDRTMAQAAPRNTAQKQQAGFVQPEAAKVRVLGAAGTEQVQLSLRLNGDGRGLRTQATSSNQLAFVRIEVRGQGLSSPRFANNGELIPVSSGSVSATIAGIPRSSGALRLITLRGYDADERELGAFELRGWYRSGASAVSPALSRRDLLLGRVLEELLTDRPGVLDALDVSALQLILDEVTGYDATSRRMFVTDPSHFLAFGVTDLIPDEASPLPNAAEITSNSLQVPETVEIDLETRLGRPFGEAVTVSLDDPGSKPARLALGAASGSTVSIPNVAPGNWTLRAYGANGEQLGETSVEVVDGVALVDQDPLPLNSARELGPIPANSFRTGHQQGGAVAIAETGDTVVVWDSQGQDGGGFGVFARRFDSTGKALGAEFQVNQHVTNRQAAADIAMDGAGNFLIVWASNGQDGSGEGVYARAFASNGTALGNEFRVSQLTNGDQYDPQVEMNDDGDAVFTWTSEGADGDDEGIVARLYNSSDGFVGNEFVVNQHITFLQQDPYVAINASGDFVIGWYNLDPAVDPEAGISARAYDRNGNPVSNEIHANDDYTAGLQIDARVAIDGDGDFVMAWSSFGIDGSDFGIVARRFERDGTPLGPGFVVNTDTEHSEMRPSLAIDPDGDFTVGWDYYAYDLDFDRYYGNVYARRYQADGTPEGEPFLLMADDHNYHVFVHLDQSAAGLAAVFMSDSFDGSGYNVNLMRYDADGDSL